MKFSIISDTHNLLRAETAEIIKKCNGLIHAGDFSAEKMRDEIFGLVKDKTNIYAVAGNNDIGWTKPLPETLSFKLFGKKFFLVHNRLYVPENIEADVIIYGHSHKYSCEEKEGKLWLNPGSCGRRRFRLPVTMAVMEIDENGMEISRIDIETDTASMPLGITPALINNIMRLSDRGETIAAISRKLKISPDFTEQIIRIKLTHPAADANAIFNKMEVNRAVGERYKR